MADQPVPLSAPRTAIAQRGLSLAFYGWRVVLALAVLRLVAGGVGIYGRGVFLLPMERDLHVGRDEISLVFALLGLQTGLMSPIAGYLIQRYGGRRVIFWGAACSGVGYVVLASVNTLWALGLVNGVLIGLGFNWAFLQAPTSITNAWFLRRKALAMSLLSAGIGVGGLLIVPSLEGLVREAGWRAASVVCGVVILALGVAVAAYVRNGPEEKGLHPDGDPAPGVASGGEAAGMAGSLTLPQALRTALFWLLLVGTVLWLSLYGSLGLHFIPLLVSKGETSTTAAWFAGIYAITTLPATMALGWLADRFRGTTVLAVAALSLAAAALVLRFADGAAGYLLAILLVAPVESIWTVLWAVLGRAYGRRSYDTIRGAIYGLILVLSAGWTWAPGIIFSRTGSYDAWLITLAGLMLATSAVFAVASRVREPHRATARAGVGVA